MTDSLTSIIQRTPDSLRVEWLDIITAIMVEANLKTVIIPPACNYTQRLCIMDREALNKSPGYDIHLCTDAAEATSIGDALYDRVNQGVH